MVVDGRRFDWAGSTRVLARVDRSRARRRTGGPRLWLATYWAGITLIGSAVTGLGLMLMGAGR
jgi:hypothetical protein